MGTALYGIDAVCMALLAFSADFWEGTSRAKGVDRAVMITQVVTLAGRRESLRATLLTQKSFGDSLCSFIF